MLAKHLAPRINEGGSFVHLFRRRRGQDRRQRFLGVAITNAAADTLARSLGPWNWPRSGSTHHLPRREIDTGAWDDLRPPGQGRLISPPSPPGTPPPDRHHRGHRPGGPVRDDQHVPDRPDAAHRRRRTAGLTLEGTTMDLAGSKGRSPRKRPAGSSVSAVQADAVFLWGLSVAMNSPRVRSGRPSPRRSGRSAAGLCRTGGTGARRSSRDRGDPDALGAQCGPRGVRQSGAGAGAEPAAGADAGSVGLIPPRLDAEQTSDTPGAGRRGRPESAAVSEA